MQKRKHANNLKDTPKNIEDDFIRGIQDIGLGHMTIHNLSLESTQNKRNKKTSTYKK